MCEAQETSPVETMTDRQLLEHVSFQLAEVLQLQKVQAAAVAQFGTMAEQFMSGGGGGLAAKLLGLGAPKDK